MTVCFAPGLRQNLQFTCGGLPTKVKSVRAPTIEGSP
jgi:hypothetical protein